MPALDATVLARFVHELKVAVTPTEREMVVAIREQGINRPMKMLSLEQAAEVISYLADRPCYNGHVVRDSDGIPRVMGSGAKDHAHGCFNQQDIPAAPHLLELALNDRILAVAAHYLGCMPTLYALHTYWNYPRNPKNPESLYVGVQTYHRDLDDLKFVTLFVFLTSNNGLNIYLPESHRIDGMAATYEATNFSEGCPEVFIPPGDISLDIFYKSTRVLHALCHRFLSERMIGLVPYAGAGFFEDGYGLHRGTSPEVPRLMFYARYGLNPDRKAENDDKGVNSLRADTGEVRRHAPEPIYLPEHYRFRLTYPSAVRFTGKRWM